jgi:hypothetical protein
MENMIELSVYFVLFITFIFMMLLFLVFWLLYTINKYYHLSEYYRNLYVDCNRVLEDTIKKRLSLSVKISELLVRLNSKKFID